MMQTRPARDVARVATLVASAARIDDPAALETFVLEQVVPAAVALDRLRRRPAAAGLSAREREILALVAQGETNPAIARRLAISPRTVQRHLDHVYTKLGVSSRTAAALAIFGPGRR